MFAPDMTNVIFVKQSAGRRSICGILNTKEENMSVVRTEIILINDGDATLARRGRIKEDEIRQMTVPAVVDTGAWTMVINEEICEKLGLDDKGHGEATFADGEEGTYKMAGPLEIRWKNRRFTCDALVLPNAKDILLGAIPLEGMDLTVNPKAEAEGFGRELVGVHGDIVMHRV